MDITAKPLSKMTKPELLAEAARLSFAVPDGATNPEIIALIEPARAAAPAVSQAEPTKPRPTDDAGHQLDEWDLPISGPIRAQRLAELGKPDPLEDPQAWAATETKE